MLRLKLLFCLTLTTLTFLSSADRADAVMLTDMQAFDSGGVSLGFATAAHGFFTKNDADGSGDPLLTLLNVGTSTGETATLAPSQSIEISSTGMFSTAGTIGDPFVDLIAGSSFQRSGIWEFLGKSDDNPSLAFASADGGNTGSLVLAGGISPLSGNVVVSLKAGSQYSVYAFANIKDVVSFEFKNLPSGLSHASLYTSTPGPTTGGPPNPVPEPASLAIFGFGALCLGVGQLRRRRNVASKTA